MDRSSILKEAIRIEIELSQLKEPNSPSKTHYMVKLSDDFIKAAGSVDTNSLLNSIKVKDISLSTLKDEKGIYAFTSKKHEFPIYEIEGSSDTTVNVLRQGREYALLQRNIPKENNPLNIKDPTPYIVAWNFNAKDGKCNWGQGHYCGSLDSGCSLYSEKEQAEKELSKVVNYKFFYAGSGGQDKDAIQFQKETGWKRIWGSDSQGLNGDTWVVYRSVEDLPKWLQEYAAAQEKSGNIETVPSENTDKSSTKDNTGVNKLREFLINLQNDEYSGKQDYFIFKKDNGDYFFVTDACNQFYHVAIGTLTADGKGDGSGQLYSIMKNARHFMDNVEYDPVERLCNMVKDMEFMGVVRDERVLIDSKSVTSYNRVRPTCEWAYALKKYQESVKNKEYWYRAHLKHKDGTVLAVIGDKDKERFNEEIAKIEQDIAAYVADIGKYKAEDLHLEILPPHRIRSKTKQETRER